MKIVETVDLISGYGRNVVLYKVSTHVEHGEIVAIIGPNGSGKSTLVKSIVGITRIFGGRVALEGRNIAATTLDQVARMGIGYVPQLDNIFTELTVEENLEMGAYTRSDRKGIKEDIQQLYGLFPALEGSSTRKAGTLSGGERQMLAIARAMMMKPKLLMLDEPTANLGPKAISSLHEKIKEINDEGVTIMAVEQNVKKALDLATRT